MCGLAIGLRASDRRREGIRDACPIVGKTIGPCHQAVRDPATCRHLDELTFRDATDNRGVFIDMTAGTDPVVTVRHRERHAVFHAALDKKNRR